MATSTDLQLKGNWHQFMGKAKKIWGDVFDDTSTSTEGTLQDFFGHVQEKTGDSMEAIQDKWNTFIDEDEEEEE
jgi:uncharacterized protein YjbJ (UPF0337 family)